MLVPRPRINLVLYYGVLAPRAPWRAAVASAGSEWSDAPAGSRAADSDGSDPSSCRRPGTYLWADLMRRTFGIDVLECPRCGGRLRLMALLGKLACRLPVANRHVLIFRLADDATQVALSRPADLVPQIDTFSEYRGYASRLREGTARSGGSIVANADSDKYASQA